MTAALLERLPTFTLAAMAIGFLVSLAFGGRFRHLAGKSFRIWLLLPIGLLLQLLVQRDGAPAPFALLLLSYVCLIGFGIANWRLTGMWLIVLGFSLNLFCIALNHGMPVSRTAIGSLGIQEQPFGVKHHLERPSDKLVFLGDIIPVPSPVNEALSFGDMIMTVGVANLLFNLMRPPRRELRARNRSSRPRPAVDKRAAPPLDDSPLSPDLQRVLDLVKADARSGSQ
jgi:Family of unknown function (DUF5317)